MKKYIFLIVDLLLISSVKMMAQGLKIESMRVLPMDLSASINQRKDVNENVCALVKVSLTVSNATFGGDVVGNVLRDGSEYWVYMPENSKMLQIKHPNFKNLMVVFADFGIGRLESKKTYLLDIGIPTGAILESQVNQSSMTQGSSFLTGRTPKTFKPRKLKDPLKAFFPLYGITLGKTTYNDARAIGYVRDDSSTGIEHDVLHIQGTFFWTKYGNEEDNTYNFITMVNKIPQQWADEFGFDESLSYNEWMALFESLGFRVDVEKEPTIGDWKGKNVFQADLQATSPNGDFYFSLNFDFGDEYGCSPDSPNTLYELGVHYSVNNKYASQINKTKNASKGFKMSSSINTFFPVYGIVLGKSTWYDVAKSGNLAMPSDNGDWFCNSHGLAFWDHDKKGYFDQLYFTHGYNMPPAWIKKGFQWGNSYNTWLKLLDNMGYTVLVVKEPTITEKDFKAEIRAISSDAHLRIDFDFSYTKGDQSTAGTLYSINMTAQ